MPFRILVLVLFATMGLTVAAEAGGDVVDTHPVRWKVRHSAPPLRRVVRERITVTEEVPVVVAAAPPPRPQIVVDDGPRWHRRAFVGRYVGGNYAYDRLTADPPGPGLHRPVEVAVAPAAVVTAQDVLAARSAPVGRPYGAEADVPPEAAVSVQMGYSFAPLTGRSQEWTRRARPEYVFGNEYEMEDRQCWRPQVLETEQGTEVRRVWSCPGG